MNWTIAIENIAGIRRGEATLEPGANAVRGTNWQGKSSFVAAVETALGTATPLTQGADGGRVELETGERTVRVDVERDGDDVVRSGTPLLTDEYDVVRADLYACLDERNPVRSAVRRGENLEEVLTRPLDFQNIDERLAALEREREQVDTELTQASEAARRLPTVEERVTQLEADIASARERLAELSDRDSTDDPSGRREDLSQARAELDRTETRIARLENSIERAENSLAEKRAEQSELDVPDESSVESELASAREELQTVKRDVEILQSLYAANKRVLDEDRLDLVTDVERELLDDRVACWVCDTVTTREDLRAAIDALGEEVTPLRGEVERHRDRVDELEARREELQQTRHRRAELEDEIADLESTLADRRESLEEARTRRDEIDERVEELSAAVAETVAEVTDLESEVKFREAELEEARDERETLEARADRLDDLEAEREELTEDIVALRNRKQEVEQRAREAFDEAMRDLLERFDTGFETARLTSTFDVVVARDGREADVDTLSEGELELLGFVAALAGFESFDVADSVPVMLLDGLGGLADDNLHTLIDYLRGRTEFLVFTAYPEHAAFDGNEVEPADWEVVSDERPAAE